tara:strand:+ start:649 stop:2037 length:1389 start_codon:yes stop_codon:yes gene_type:complete
MIEVNKKKKMSDMRIHLSDKVIKDLRPKIKQYSKGDDEVVGLRVFVYPSGAKTFHYCYTDLDGRKQKERLESTSVINCVAARNRARKIAAQVMEGIANSQIKRGLSTEPTVSQLFEQYEKNRLKAPKYKTSTISKWKTYRKCWIDKNTDDKIIRGMFVKSKLDLGSIKLSKVNMDILKEYHKFIGDKSHDPANAIIQMMSVVFNYAIERKLISSNPVRFKKEDFYKQKENNRYLNKSQMEAVLDYVLKYDERSQTPKLNHDYYRNKNLKIVSCCVIAKALLDGHRYRNEGAVLKWSQVSFPLKKLFFMDTKTGQQEYNIGPKAFKLLTAIRNERFREGSQFFYPNDIRSQYVFPSYNFGKINNAGKVNERPYVHTVHGTWRTCLKALKIEYLPMYNCRHSYLTEGLRKTGNLKMIKEIAGHKKITTTERYARIIGKDVTAALDLIDQEEVSPSKIIKFESNK